MGAHRLPPHGAALCFWVQRVLLTRGWGPHLGSAQDHRGADQGARGVPCAARGGPYLHAFANSPAKFANSALPKHLVLRSAFSSCIPYDTDVPGLGQLQGKVFLPQPTRRAELYPAQCRIPRLLMPHRGPAVPASLPRAVCAEPGWLLGLSMTSAFLLGVGRSPRGCRNLVNHEYFWSDSSGVCVRWFLLCRGRDGCLVAGGDVVPGDVQLPRLSQGRHWRCCLPPSRDGEGS